MPTALAIRHVHFEDLGAFAIPLAEAGYEIRYVDVGLDALDAQAMAAADLLIVLGGPVGVGDAAAYPFLRDEMDALRTQLAARAPTLGVCLGAQLMAAALGARVAPGPAKEIGWASLDLTEAGRSGPLRHFADVPVLHWHGDAFAMPNGAERLASTPLCPNQAFALGDHALGVQFHPEADGRGFERWLVGHAAEIAATPDLSVDTLRADALRFGPASGEAGRLCLREWLSRIVR